MKTQAKVYNSPQLQLILTMSRLDAIRLQTVLTLGREHATFPEQAVANKVLSDLFDMVEETEEKEES